MIEIVRTDSTNVIFNMLISQLDKELSERYGEAQKKHDKHNLIESCDTVIIAWDDKTPAGCGCYKKYSYETAEIKRMYVETNYRGQGISKKILGELETWAKEKGYKRTILETGNNQPEAISLYQNSGYKRIVNYGQYIGLSTSICMIKEL